MEKITSFLQPAKVDTLKFGTMFIVSKLLADRLSPTFFRDTQWLRRSLFTIIGFAVYTLIIARYLHITLDSELKEVAFVFAKIGTMLVVSRILVNGVSSVNDKEWITETIMILIGFSLYNIMTSKMVDTTGMASKRRAVIEDTLNFGTMFLFTKVMADGNLLDPAWIKEVALTLIGFSVYNVFIA